MKFLRILPSERKTHVVVWRNKSDLDKISIDDLYNNLKIIEQEVKRNAGLSSSFGSQNIAFVSTPSTGNNDDVSTVFGVSTTSPQVKQIHEDDLEEMDLKWQLALLSIKAKRVLRNQDNRTRNKEITRRTVNMEDTSSIAMVAIDGAGFDWSYMADDEAPTNMAFMAFSDSELEKISKEKDDNEIKIEKSKNASQSLDKFIGSQITDKGKKGLGYVSYNAVPPPHTERFSPPRIDLSHTGLPEFAEPSVESYGVKLIEVDWESEGEDEVESPPEIERKTVEPSVDKRERMVDETNHSMVNHSANTVPKAVLTRIGLKPVNTIRPINPKSTKRPNLAVLNAVRANKGKAVKASACWVWRPIKLDSALIVLKKHTNIDARGRSKHMTGNISYLTDFKEFDEGYVAFRGGAKGFWCTPSARSLDNVEIELNATVNGQDKTITKASVRRHLKLVDANGISTLPTTEIFEQHALMGYIKDSDKLTFQKGHFSSQWRFLIHTILHCLSAKKNSWEQFSSNIAIAIICLATNRMFNFSKLIFDGMVKKWENKYKFLMYLRFLQLILNKESTLNTSHKRLYIATNLTQKVFSNMKRESRDFSGMETTLFPTMLINEQLSQGEGPRSPVGTQHTPTIIETSPQLQNISNTYRKTRTRTRRMGIRIPQSNIPSSVADEAVTKGMHDGLGRDTTTASRLAAEQGSGNISKTQTKATPSRPSSLRTSLEGGLGCHVTMGEVLFRLGLKGYLTCPMKHHSEKRTQLEMGRAQREAHETAGHRKESDDTEVVDFSTTSPQKDDDEITLAETLVNIKRVQQKIKSGGDVFDLIGDVDPPDEGRDIRMGDSTGVSASLDGEIFSGGKKCQESNIGDSDNTADGAFDREDLVKLWSLVKERFSSSNPTEDKEISLWVELKRLFEPDEDDELSNFESFELIWRLRTFKKDLHADKKTKKVKCLEESLKYRRFNSRNLNIQREITSLGEDCWELNVYILSTVMIEVSTANAILVLFKVIQEMAKCVSTASVKLVLPLLT
nr:hypothetical protein [Tanacetum cinerariifolium]